MPLLLTQVELRDRKDRLLQLLQMIDPTIENVMMLKQEGRDLEVYWRNQEGAVPLAYAGDGMRNLAAIAMQILSADGGILLIDEQEFDGQIIATTHSYEFVSLATKAMDSDEETRNDFSLYRLNRELRPDEPRRRGKRRRIVKYSRNDVDTSLAYGTEVR